jgi:hypothetical protein
MSPDLIYILMLALRMTLVAALVVTASVITERSGPVIGALIATLPISAGPSYVFLALDHDAVFIAEGALASLAINAATLLLSLTYVVLAQRWNAVVSIAGAMGWRCGRRRSTQRPSRKRSAGHCSTRDRSHPGDLHLQPSQSHRYSQ